MLEKKFTITIPSVPNFIKVGEQSLSIADFSEAELRAIGRAWTEDLLKAGKKKRATRPRGISSSAPARLPELPELTDDPVGDSLHDRAHSSFGENPHAGDHEDFPIANA